MDTMIIHLKLVLLVKNRIIEMPPFVGLAAWNGHSFGSVTRSGSVTCGRESNEVRRSSYFGNPATIC